MSNMVRWRELESVFRHHFPRTIDSVVMEETPAEVKYCGVQYAIMPNRINVGFGTASTFEVWGPPFVNHFPE